MQLVCLLCQVVLPSTDQRFGRHMVEMHNMVPGHDLVKYLLACHFLNEPERALLRVRMEKRVEAHMLSEMVVSESEVMVLEPPKEPPAVTNFSIQLMKAMAETKVEKSGENASLAESQVHLTDHNVSDRHKSFEQEFRQVNSTQTVQHSIEKTADKNVFIKCRLCLSKVRKDLFEDHKSEHHPDFNDLTANMKNEAATLAEESGCQQNENVQPQKAINVHPATIKHIFCKPCQRQFYDGVLYEKHKIQEHGRNAPARLASPNTQQFETSKTNEHIDTCKLCYVKIFSKRTKRRHEVEYHKADAHLFNVDIEKIKRDSKCETCGMLFASEEIVKFHSKYIHGNKHLPNNAQPLKLNTNECLKKDPGDLMTFSFDNQIGKFVCSVCSAIIKDKWKMKRHMRNIHSVQNMIN